MNLADRFAHRSSVFSVVAGAAAGSGSGATGRVGLWIRARGGSRAGGAGEAAAAQARAAVAPRSADRSGTASTAVTATRAGGTTSRPSGERVGLHGQRILLPEWLFDQWGYDIEIKNNDMQNYQRTASRHDRPSSTGLIAAHSTARRACPVGSSTTISPRTCTSRPEPTRRSTPTISGAPTSTRR